MLTQEQKDLRKTGIGASEIAAVCGLNPWCSAHEVWLEKTGRQERQVDPESIPIVRGNIKEAMLIDWYRHDTGNKVRYAGRHQRTLQSKRYQLCFATPDGLVGTRGGVECKAPGRFTMHHWGEPGTDDVPEYYLPQAQWQMEAADLNWVDFAVDLGDELGIYRVMRDNSQIKIMAAIAHNFWHMHVLTDTPPPIDESDGCASMLDVLYPRQERPELLDADYDTQILMEDLKRAKQFEKDLKEYTDLTKNKLKALIGEDRGFQGECGKVIWSNVKGGTSVNWKSIAEEIHGSTKEIPEDLIQKHTQIGAGYRALKSYWKKEAK